MQVEHALSVGSANIMLRKVRNLLHLLTIEHTLLKIKLLAIQWGSCMYLNAIAVCQTLEELQGRIAEHVNNIKKGLQTHNVSKHFRNFHNRDPQMSQILGLE